MTTRFDIIDGELRYRGEVYMICRERGDDFDTALASLCREAAARGAVRACVADRTGALDAAEGFTAGGYAFRRYSDFIELRKPVALKPATLRLKRMTAGNAELWAALMNEIFSFVPNAMTYGGDETAALTADENKDAGFLMEGGRPVGIYVLEYSEESAEIAAVGVTDELRGQGYGVRALDALENRTAERGYAAVKLLVADANAPALKLYERHGYGDARFISRWFSTAL